VSEDLATTVWDSSQRTFKRLYSCVTLPPRCGEFLENGAFVSWKARDTPFSLISWTYFLICSGVTSSLKTTMNLAIEQRDWSEPYAYRSMRGWACVGKEQRTWWLEISEELKRRSAAFAVYESGSRRRVGLFSVYISPRLLEGCHVNPRNLLVATTLHSYSRTAANLICTSPEKFHLLPFCDLAVVLTGQTDTPPPPPPPPTL
jgi:hypothetical protein